MPVPPNIDFGTLPQLPQLYTSIGTNASCPVGEIIADNLLIIVELINNTLLQYSHFKVSACDKSTCCCFCFHIGFIGFVLIL